MKTKIFKIKSALTARIIYKNLFNFITRYPEGREVNYIKIQVKISTTLSSGATKISFKSLSKISYIDLNNKQDIINYINFCTNNFNKYMDQYSPIITNILLLEYQIINRKDYINNFKYNQWLEGGELNFDEFDFPLTTEYNKYADGFKYKFIGNTRYNYYSKCKGFKNSENATFVVNNIHDDENIEINAVTLTIKNQTFMFNDKLIKNTGTITRTFINSKQEINEISKSSLVKNVGTIDPIKNNFLKDQAKILTLDCETYLVNKVQKLLSVAFYDGKISKFYFIADHKNEAELIKALLFDLLKYNGHNIYIHNGIRFDLIFLFKHFIKVAKDNNFEIELIYKDGEILNFSVIKIEAQSERHNNSRYRRLRTRSKNLKKNIKIIHFKDSYKLLLGSLSNLAKNFGCSSSEGKGSFPFDFAKTENFNYIGPTPDIKYYSFNGKSLLNYSDYLPLVKQNWCFRDELKIYNIQDCVVLYNILIKFDALIRSTFNFNFKNNPTLSSLAFSLYRYKYIPENLKYTVKIGKRNIIKSHIDNLNEKYDVFVRQSYFGGHVDSYIPYFKAAPSQNNMGGGANQVLYHYDVVSLYPYIMQQFKLPYKVNQFIEGNILLNNKALFDSSTGFYKVRVITTKGLANPILPYRNSNNIVLYPEGSWIGTYYSEEIKNAIKFGYKFEIISGYLFDCDYLFKEYIGELFNIKQNSTKGTPLYLISKLLMNSLYGKFGIHFELPNYTVINKNDLLGLASPGSATVSGTEAVDYDDKIDLENGYVLVNKKNDNTIPLGNVAIASAITALARVHMSQFKNNPNYNLYYTDTDSAIIDQPLSDTFTGKNLGQMTLENTYSKFITFGPKFYGGITLDGQEIVKIKGLSHQVLPSFSELELLLSKGKFLEKEQTKVFKDLSLSEITLKNLPYLLKPTCNKRDFVYTNSCIVGTKNKVITE